MDAIDNLNSLYNQLASRNELLYRFVTRHSELLQHRRPYDKSEDTYTTIEMHTLSMIDANPGITVSELAKNWNRTKSTVSVNIKRLFEKKLIYKVTDEKDAKVQRLFLTEKGQTLSTEHKLFDARVALAVYEKLIKATSVGEVETFYKVMEIYLKIMDEAK